MAFLYPGAERRRAIALLDAMRAEMDLIHEAEKPIMALAREVADLAKPEEMKGKRLTKVFVPRARLDELDRAHEQVSALRKQPLLGPSVGGRLFGMEIVEGPELRVE